MNMEYASKMWDQYVGQQGAREFMELSPSKDVRRAVYEYLTHLDTMFGAGTSENAPNDLDEALVAYIENEMKFFPKVQMYGKWVDYEAAASLMDDEIREELHNEMAPCEPQAFMDAYLVRHEAKFGEKFEI